MHFGAPVKKFASYRSGQFAIIFSLCLIPVFAGVGMAVDYTYLVQSKTRLHDATDAAALFAARQYRLTGKLPAKSKVLAFVFLFNKYYRNFYFNQKKFSYSNGDAKVRAFVFS